MERIANQYRIIAAGAGWIDRSARGRLKFAGKDARAFLQALVTNDLDADRRGLRASTRRTSRRRDG